MKNIFASEKFDDIILREYAELGDEYRAVYRIVAALETMGIRVHRQLVMRLLGIQADAIMGVLNGLADIVTEYTIDRREHIYGWKGRHQVINGIVSKYKFNNAEDRIKLFDLVIDNTYPTYDIELRSIRELCNIETGLATIADKETQNRLLRKMISVAPGERVPRHRLIKNLIALGKFDQAHTEIRIFEKDFGSDGPVARYSVNLMRARATETPGIMLEDRLVILEEARKLALNVIERFSLTPWVFGAYCIAFYCRKRYPKLDEALLQYRKIIETIAAVSPDLDNLSPKYKDPRNPLVRELAELGAWNHAVSETIWRPVADCSSSKAVLSVYSEMCRIVACRELRPHCFGVDQRSLSSIMGKSKRAVEKALQRAAKEGVIVVLHPGKSGSARIWLYRHVWFAGCWRKRRGRLERRMRIPRPQDTLPTRASLRVFGAVTATDCAKSAFLGHGS